TTSFAGFSLGLNIQNTAAIHPHRHHQAPNRFENNRRGELPKSVHAKVIKNASVQQLHVSNYLLHLYVKSHDSIHAHRLFDEMSDRDVRSWTILISGLARYGSCTMSVDLCCQDAKGSIPPSQFTFSSMLKCCSTASDVGMGKATHGWILRHGISLNITLEYSIPDFYVKLTVLCNAMISGYLRVGDMESSTDWFERLPVKDVASWNTIIDGHLRKGFERIGLELLYQMVKIGPALAKSLPT
ncbi:hypothetical protein RJ639_019724, partial [Escallonia herrerae]